jgi:basic membrane protein A and related proteins
MRVFLVIGLSILAWCATPSGASADHDMTFWPQAVPPAPVDAAIKPVAVIYFAGRDDGRIKEMIAQSKSDFRLHVEGHRLNNEDDLPDRIETIAENPVGMIVVVAPQKLDRLLKIPSLYPDIRFSIIDVERPIYLANVRSLIFNEQEGAFLIGALASLYSSSGKIAALGGDDTPRARNMVYGFMQGAKYARQDVEVSHYLTRKKPSLNGNTDTVFLVDREPLSHVLLKPAPKKPWAIVYGSNPSDPASPVLTSLIKHQDLALYAVLKSYAQSQWSPGSETLGLAGGYFDYALDSRNKALLTKDTVARIEEIKDLVSQHIVEIAPANQ